MSRIASSQIIGEPMIDIAMTSLVRANYHDDIAQSCVRSQLPVVNRDFWRRHIRFRAAVQFSEVLGVTVDRLFLKITNEAVRGLWRKQLEQKKQVVENALGDQNQQALEPRRLGDVYKCHQVHALVLRLIQECADPAVIAFHPAQRTKMLQGTTDHARYRRNGFEHNRAMTIPPGEKPVGKKAQKFDEPKSNPVGYNIWSMVLLRRSRNRHVLVPVARGSDQP